MMRHLIHIYLYVCMCVTVLSDGHPRRTLHGVRMSWTTAVPALRPRASRTHPQLCATRADLLRDPGPLSSVSALTASPGSIGLYRATANGVNATSGNPRRSDRPISTIVDIPFAIRRVHLPPPSMHTNDWHARVEKNFLVGKVRWLSSKWESESIEFALCQWATYTTNYAEDSLAHKRQSSVRPVFVRARTQKNLSTYRADLEE